MTIWEALILGVVQGLTEFLPVSSSGHLALAKALLGREPGGGALYEVLLHVGSVGSIVTVFHREVRALLAATLRIFRGRPRGTSWREDSEVHMVAAILLSAIPAGVIGLCFREPLEALFDRPRLVAVFLAITGVILFSHRWLPPSSGGLTFKRALIMGVAQAIAILPGISRSGSTITAGLWSGLNREEAGRFAFLMAIPPILGAGLLELMHHGGAAKADLVPVLGGVLASYVTGIFALRVLLGFVRRGGFAIFSLWVWLVAAVALAFL